MTSNATELMRLMVVREPQPKPGARAILLVPGAALARAAADLGFNLARAALAAFGSKPGSVLASDAEVANGEALVAFRAEALVAADSVDPGELVKRAFGKPAADLVADPKWMDAVHRLSDFILFYKLAWRSGPRPLAALADLYRGMAAVAAVASGEAARGADLGALLEAPLRLPPPFARVAMTDGDDGAAGDRKAKAIELAVAKVREKVALHAEDQAIGKAIDEIAAVPVNAKNFELAPAVSITDGAMAKAAPQTAQDVKTPADPNPPIENDLAQRWVARSRALAVGAVALGQSDGPALKLTADAAKSLSAPSRDLIKSFGLDAAAAPVEGIADLLVARRVLVRKQQDSIGRVATAPAAGALGRVVVSRGVRPTPLDPTPPIPFPENLRIPDDLVVNWHDLLADSGFPGDTTIFEPDRGPSLLRPAGVGQLYVIRQQITGYRAGEISHIENILPGETRERHHRRLKQQEVTQTDLQETETEEEKSVQTTNRTELEREVQSTIKRQFDYGASAQVSGDYGKVSFTASGQVHGTNAVELATKTAQKVASEIVETSRQRVTERIRTERILRTLEELEEINVHNFSGASLTEPLNGVYQWVDKVYRNEVWTWGNRTMYEVIVPEPAAGLIAAATAPNADRPNLVEKPAPINVAIDTLTPSRVAQLCAQYGVVENIDVHPEPTIVGLAFSAQGDDSSENNFYAETKDVDVPDGYEFVDGWMAVRARGDSATPKIGIMIGSASKRFVTENIRYDQYPSGGVHFSINHDGPKAVVDKLQAAVAVDDYSAIAITIQLLLEPSEALLDKWRRSAFAAIRGAYDARMSEWREYQAQVEVTEPGLSDKLFGRNPDSNRELARQELQRSAIEIFRNLSLDFDLIREGSVSDAVTRIDFPAQAAASPEILFLSQAFEWPNMTFILYPYFYGRRHEWPQKLLFADVDTNFIEFLKSGAARVQVPVRPGFEAAVDHYMMTREPFFGQGMPFIGDDLYLPYLDEVRDADGAALGGTHAEDLDFEVTVPTELVVARNGRAIDVDGGTLPKWERVGDQWREVQV